MDQHQIEEFLVSMANTFLNQHSDSERTNIELQITKFVKEPNYLPAIFSLLENKQLPHNIFNFLLIFFAKTVGQIHLQPSELGKFIFFSLVQLLRRQDLILKHQKIISGYIKMCFSFGFTQKNSATIKTIRITFLDFIKNIDFSRTNPLFTDPFQLRSLLITLKAFLKSSQDTLTVINFELYQNLLKNIYDLIIDANFAILLSDEFNDNNLKFVENQQKLTFILQIQQNFISCCNVHLKNQVKLETNRAKLRESTQLFGKISFQFFTLKISHLLKDSNNIVFFPTDIKTINEMINSIQIKCMSSFISIFKINNKIKLTSNQLNVDNSSLFLHLDMIIRPINTASWSYFSKKTRSNLENDNVEAIMRISVKYFAHIVQTLDFFETFSSIKENFFSFFLFPNLMISNDELLNFTENPSDFTNYTMDLLGDLKSKSLRSMSIKLLSKMCVSIDGFLTYVCSFFEELIFLLISENKIDSKKTYQSIYSSFYFQNTSHECLLESSILCLTSLFEFIKKRGDLIEILRKIVILMGRFVIQPNTSDLVKSRYIGLLATSMRHVFAINSDCQNPTKDENQMNIIDSCRWILSQINSNSSTSLIAIKYFWQLTKKQKILNLISEHFFALILDTSIRSIEKNNSIEVFSMTSKLFVQNRDQLNQVFPQIQLIIPKFFKRILNESEANSQMSSHIIQLCFDNLTILSENEQILNNCLDILQFHCANFFEQPCLNMSMWMESLVGIYFNMSKFSHNLGPFRHKVFSQFKRIHDTNIENVKEIFIFTGMLLQYHPEDFTPDKIGIILNIIKNSLSKKRKNEKFYDIEAYSYLLLQILIQIVGHTFTDEMILFCFELYESAMNRFFATTSDKSFSNVDKALGIYFSLILTFDHNRILPKLELKNIEKIIEITFQNASFFKTLYEIKLLCFAMLQIMRIVINLYVQEVPSLTLKIFSWLVSFLKYQQVQRIAEEISKKNECSDFESRIIHDYEDLCEILLVKQQGFYDYGVDINYDFENDDEEDDSDKIEAVLTKRKKEFVNKLYSPLIEKDEYIGFQAFYIEQNEFFTCSQNNKNNLREICYLDDVLKRIRYVKIEENGRQIHIPRKIVQIARQH